MVVLAAMEVEEEALRPVGTAAGRVEASLAARRAEAGYRPTPVLG